MKFQGMSSLFIVRFITMQGLVLLPLVFYMGKTRRVHDPRSVEVHSPKDFNST